MKEIEEERIVAFVDILGFERLIERMNEGESWLFGHLKNTLQLIEKTIEKMYSKHPGLDKRIRPHIEATAFSDSVVISGHPESDFPVLFTVGSLAAFQLKRGILCRGGIAMGQMYHKRDILFGKALIDAYKIETNIAGYPRIVVQDEIADGLCKRDNGNSINYRSSAMLKRDMDGSWFLNTLMPPLADISATKKEDLPKAKEKHFRELRKRITEGLEKAALQDPQGLSILNKYRWLANQFNTSLPEELRNGIPIIEIGINLHHS